MNCTLDMRELDGTGIKQGRQCVRETALYQTHSFLAVFFGFILIFQQINATFPFFPLSTFRIRFSFCCLFVTFEFHLLANNILVFLLILLIFTHDIFGKSLSFMYSLLYYFTHLETRFEESSPFKFLFQY